MQTETIKVSKLKLNPNNPRVIKDDKYKKLLKSIKDFPKMLQLRPIVVNDDMVVLGGNQRLKACKEAGYKEVPTIKASELTADEQREFIIKDNIGFGENDWDMLANEWNAEELQEWGMELPEGWNEDEVLEAKEDDFDEEPPENPITELGDLYEIGEHRLLCGDSTYSEQVAKLMNGKKADMVLTDPPYGMKLDTDWSDVRGGKYSEVIGDDKEFDPKPFLEYFKEVKEQFWWGADYYSRSLPYDVGSWFVWDKRSEEGFESSGNPDAMIGSMFELCWSKNKHRREILRFRWAGSYGLWQDDTDGRVHPTQKPAGMVGKIISKYGDENDIVADLFLGSGSTMVASHQLKRKCYGIELDPKYCDVIVRRMIKLDASLQIKRNGQQITHEEFTTAEA